MEKYKFESKQDEAYSKTFFRNYQSLGKAINQAGGCWEFIFPEYEKLLDNLARNNIIIEATFNSTKNL